MTSHTDDADQRYRDWMLRAFDRAATALGVTVATAPTFGWLDRSVNAPTTDQHWLRVVSELPEWAHGHTWTGNLDANQLTDISKPRVLATREWTDNPRHVRAELMTKLPGQPCAAQSTPPAALHLSAEWWHQLRAALDQVRTTSTDRINAGQTHVNRRGQQAFGTAITIKRWETVHGDLHWANLLRDPFGIVDWELWGTGPAGTDAATLYLYSLANPAIAADVHKRLADHLDTPDGQIAQRYVAARILHRGTFGDHPELVAPLRRHANRLGLEPNSTHSD